MQGEEGCVRIGSLYSQSILIVALKNGIYARMWGYTILYAAPYCLQSPNFQRLVFIYAASLRTSPAADCKSHLVASP